MKNILKKSLELYHKHFEDENNQYSEYEPSDIEYFVGCLLYNNFKFKFSLATMKTMDVGSDFLEASKSIYLEEMALLESIKFDNELEAIEFLLEFIDESKSKYTPSENYLLDRLNTHINTLKDRTISGDIPETINFEKPKNDEKKIEDPLEKMREINTLLGR